MKLPIYARLSSLLLGRSVRRWGVVLLIAAWMFCLGALNAVAGCLDVTNITSWWPGDNMANDVAGGRHAILRGGVVYAPGLVRAAFNLDGNSQFVDVPDDPGLNVGTNDFTFELWVRFNALSGEQVIAEKYIETFTVARTGWSLAKLQDNTIRWALAGGGDVDSLPASTVIPDTNTWTHIAVRRSGTTFSTFQNGVASASGNFTRNLDTTSSLKFGHRGNPSDTPGSTDPREFWLNGSIDEPTLYVNRALSDQQIAAIYAAGAAGKCRGALEITSVQSPTSIGGLHSFISTDAITLKATLSSNVQNAPVEWSVLGLQAAAGISGFPTNEVHNTDSQGISTFIFTPSANTAFVQNRRTIWTRGDTNPNPAIEFDVIATVVLSGTTNMSRLSTTTLGPLRQDETDTLRQEYVDYQIPVFGRQAIVPSLGAGFNRGNYGVQVSSNLIIKYNAIVASYRGSSVVVNGQPMAIPATAAVVASSGYRNPRRNTAVGSRFPYSRHTRGRALDLTPAPVMLWINHTNRVRLNLHTNLYPALATAAATQGSAIAEQGSLPVPIGDPRENHIHVQW